MSVWMSNGGFKRIPGARRGSIVLFGLSALAAVGLSLAPIARAAPAWVWTVTFAESKLETDYQTVDPWALRDAREQLAADLRAGWPEASSRIRHDRQDIAAAKRAGYVGRAWCKGTGTNDGTYYGRFWCRMRLKSDLSGYQATRQLTLIVRGRESFVTRPGWR